MTTLPLNSPVKSFTAASQIIIKRGHVAGHIRYNQTQKIRSLLQKLICLLLRLATSDNYWSRASTSSCREARLRTSSYFEHLQSLNARRKAQGKQPIPITEADENLEDYDLLDMVNAGAIQAIVVDSHKAIFWEKVFDKIKVHRNLSVHSGNRIAWAMRKNSPELMRSITAFSQKVKKGSLLGNILIKRYLGDTKWLENVAAGENHKNYEETIEFIKHFADQYGFDWIIIAAQAYQESRFDQSKRSKSGAVGVMQVLPSTAADKAVGIPDISTVENNIHAGVKYLHWLRQTYYSGPEISELDRVLFSFAAYNAGPGNMRRARQRAKRLGFDANRWFRNVEIGMYRAVSGEPASYVRNIYKYYITYRGLEESRQAREKVLRDQAANNQMGPAEGSQLALEPARSGSVSAR